MQIKPRGLFVRFTMMIVLPILMLITTSTYIFYQRHWDNISSRMQAALINEVLLVAKAHSIGDREISGQLGFTTDVIARDKLQKTNPRFENLAAELTHALRHDVRVTATEHKLLLIQIDYNSHILEITCSLKRIESSTTILFVLWLVGAALIVVLISMIFMKKQVEAIIELSDFADRLGKGQDVGIIRVYGASEIRKLARAFIKMKGRIERQIKYRTELLAHISHDLRTPLTRIRLNLALLDEGTPINDILDEVTQMEHLIESYLNFAKEEGTEITSTFNFIKLLDALRQRYNEQIVFVLPRQKNIRVTLRYNAVYRAITNVLENAIKYSNSRVSCTASYEHNIITINIDDDGAGIPKKHYKTVFEPFHKIGNEKDGYGLGLAIVKNIIYGHGGKIELGRSHLGGLNVRIKIPV